MNRGNIVPPITDFLHRKAVAAGIPFSGTFELTPVCNMNCRMCYVRMSRQEQEAVRPLRSAEEWLSLGKTAVDAGMVYLLLTGGEPFLHPEFRQILAGLHEMGLMLTVNTNGTLIDEDTVRWLCQTPPLRLNMTIYGASDATYERLCGNPKGFTQFSNAIHLLKKAGISVKLNCSLTPYNVSDLPGMVRFAREHNLILQVATYMFPPIRREPGHFGDNARFDPEEAAYYQVYSEALQYDRDIFLQLPDDAALVGADSEDACAGEGDISRCRAGRCCFWITWEGKMLPCGLFPGENAPNVFEDDFSRCWDDTREFISGLRLSSQCASCDAKKSCMTCAAMIYSECGSFDRTPLYRCRLTAAVPKYRRFFKDYLRANEDFASSGHWIPWKGD